MSNEYDKVDYKDKPDAGAPPQAVQEVPVDTPAPVVPVSVTIAPFIPIFLTKFDPQNPSITPKFSKDVRIQLYNMILFGRDFRTNSGVNARLLSKLIMAQARLYKIFLDDQSKSYSTGDDETAKRDFRNWCWKGYPSNNVRFEDEVIKHIGYRSSYLDNHNTGSAIDINYPYTPYIAENTGTEYSGEYHSSKWFEFPVTNLPDFHKYKLWKPAVEAYHNAVKNSSPAESKVEIQDFRQAILDNPSFVRDVYDKFKIVHDAMREYFKSCNPLIKTLSEARNKTEIDYIYVRWNMVMGDIIFTGEDPNQWKLSPDSSYRDPREGFLNFRKEMVEQLVNDEGLRWGACMFGASVSGDIQHFDLSTKYGNGRYYELYAKDHDIFGNEDDIKSAVNKVREILNKKEN